MKRIIPIVIGCLLLGFGSACADSFSLDANVNNSVLDAKAVGEWEIRPNFLEVSPFFMYDNDDYMLAGADVAMSSRFRGDDDFRIGLGVRGFWGKVENENDDEDDGEISGVGLQLLGRYDLSRAMRAPLEIGAQFTGALSPMTFMDADGYLEFETTVGLYVLENRLGMVYTGYRYLDIGFDSDFDHDDLNKHEFFGGIRFTF